MDINVSLDAALQTAFLRVQGYLDAATAERLQQEIRELASGKCLYLAVDLSEVSFISSSGVGVFIGVTHALRSRGGDLLFINPSPPVLNVFEILGILNVFRIENSEASARNYLARRRR